MRHGIKWVMEEERKTGAIQIRHTGERIVGKNNYCLKFKKKKKPLQLTQVSTDKGSYITQMIG